jgi:hypothetical protein
MSDLESGVNKLARNLGADFVQPAGEMEGGRFFTRLT